MAIETRYDQVSGRSAGECSFLGYRLDSDHGMHPGEFESWVMCSTLQDNGKYFVRAQYPAPRWYTGLWRSPAGVTYVCDGDGDIHINVDMRVSDSNLRWTRERLDAALFGVFGLDDQNVWLWSQRKVTKPVMFAWDGARWSEMPAPDFDVTRIHGTSADRLWAVGRAGGLGHWDGTSWRRLSCPVAEGLTSVFMVSEDEIYATSERGALLEGSASGWSVLGKGPGPGTPLFDVAKWKGEVWLAAGPSGLLRRVGASNDFEVKKPNIHATRFDARVDLLMATPTLIAGTADGIAYTGVGQNMLLNLRAGKPLLDVL